MALRTYFKIQIILWWAFSWPLTGGFAQRPEALPPSGPFSRLDGLTEAPVTAICQDNRGFLWIGTSHGLNRYDGTRVLAFYHAPFDTTSLSDNHITALWNDPNGMLWIGTRQGLNRYDPRSGSFTRFLHNPNTAGTLRSNTITCIAGSASTPQLLWVGTDKGVDRLKIENPEHEHSKVTIDRLPAKPTGQPVRQLFVDGQGRLWVSTATALFHTVAPCTSDNPVEFTTVTQADVPRGTASANQTCSFIPDSGQSFWIVSGKAIIRVEENSLHQPHYTAFFYPGAGELANPALAALDWRRKIFLLDNKNKPLLFNTQSRTFETPGSYYARLANAYDCTSIFCDRSRNIWVGTAGSGLFKYSLRNDLFHASGWSARPAHATYDHSLHFGNGIIDQNGWLWHPHKEGLACIDPSRGKVSVFHHDPTDSNSLSQDHVTVLLADPAMPERYLWVGTRGGGLNRLDRHTNHFSHYLEKNGLANSTITAILPDGQGHLWVSTSQGISQLQLDGKRQVVRVQNFGREHGLPEAAFDADAAFRATDGQLCFGGTNGWVWFYPDSVNDLLPAPPVVITDLRIHHQAVSHTGLGTPLSRPVSETKEITLPYHQNTLGFAFAALDFVAPEQNRYAYYLENYDAGWNEVGNHPEAMYTNLPPGRYTLHVRACNAGGVWNEEGARLVILIRAPWWKSWWAILLFAGLAGALMWSIFRSADRHRKLLQEAAVERARADEKQRQAENLEVQSQKLADAFLALKEKNSEVIAIQQKLIAQDRLATLGQLIAGIAHEIKTPLNFVTNFSDIAAEQADELLAELPPLQASIPPATYQNIHQLAADIRENTIDSRDNGQRALNIMHHLLNLSRGEEDRFYAIDLHALLDENLKLAYHGYRAIAPDFNVTIEKAYDPAIGQIEALPADLGRVLLNILNNAFEATHQKQQAAGKAYEPVLQLHTETTPAGVQIRIRDNGAGIPEDVQHKIFQPFFTTKPSGNGNAGLGLSISRDIIVKKHGGRLEVSSRSGEFTEFRIWLPARQDSH
ncbi:MAG: sensor histidine kinase [Bacteroidetes bacterium]|nr:MAG: sensor histidine kinase [Bacteroidota bacterium]